MQNTLALAEKEKKYAKFSFRLNEKSHFRVTLVCIQLKLLSDFYALAVGTCSIEAAVLLASTLWQAVLLVIAADLGSCAIVTYIEASVLVLAAYTCRGICAFGT
jgi:hypothetical protein